MKLFKTKEGIMAYNWSNCSAPASIALHHASSLQEKKELWKNV
jgi:hypothetical protein